MSKPQRFSLRSAVTDSVATGRRVEAATTAEPDEPAAPPLDRPETVATPRPARARGRGEGATKRPATRQGARGITVWVEPEVYRMVKLVALDSDMTTQDAMMEAIDDFLAKKGKGRITKTR